LIAVCILFLVKITWILYDKNKGCKCFFFENYYLGFALGDTIESKTKGIWVLCKEHPTQPNTVLLLLDTEGLGDVAKVCKVYQIYVSLEKNRS
jgi:hypothetical protein